ncbi:MAG: cytochrome C [Acidobacteria bacterium]|nr:cytochrome C [Acidobacteriota bacterium]
MAGKTVLKVLGAVLGLGFLMACSLVSPETSFAATHPQETGAGRPMCSECHTTDLSKGALKPYAALDHTGDFVKDHRFQATQDLNSCSSCHAPAFCGDCHAGKAPMKPAIRLSDRPDRMAPHRGDYMTLHRMEGKMDPSSCYTCHGRANNDKCRVCHR